MKKEKNIGIILAIIIIFIIIIFMVISLLNKPVYKVTFSINGKESTKVVEVKAKEKLKKPENPTKEGHEFIGWYFEDKEFDFNTEITKDITIIAKWEKIEAKKVKLRFDSLEGTKVEDIEIELGSILENIPNPTKEDYIFEGWYYQNKAFDFTRPIIEDITFVAKWKKDTRKKYTVSFDTDGGSSIESVTVRENSVLIEPVEPTKDGYTFEGWYLNDSKYDFASLITKDITLTAKWAKN